MVWSNEEIDGLFLFELFYHPVLNEMGSLGNPYESGSPTKEQS